MKKDNKSEASCRLGRVGGSALLEGVMMRAGENIATTCRREDGSLCVIKSKHTSLRKKYKIFNLPILRGVVNFIESMALSVKTLNVSAEMYGGEEEETRAEKWMKKHLGVGLFDILMVFATVLGVLLSIGLFLYLPKLATSGIDFLTGGLLPLWAEGLIEGGMKVAIFVAYIWLVSLMKDIRRTFMYHGAEHKSIACYEAGAELTPAEAKKYTRFHPRCGTSFMFVMILLGVVIGIALRYILPAAIVSNSWLYTAIRLLLLPFVVGIGFEFILYAGKHQNALTRILSAPGLWMQNLTTREPDEAMLEVAITSLKAALAEEFPDFDTAEYEENARRIMEKEENTTPMCCEGEENTPGAEKTDDTQGA
ncbi:MAG: DUF1385 domain-containing protein [Clostridia bacterium]|nr:DUF1385 domain-containing protein [Clostridia bacterium]